MKGEKGEREGINREGRKVKGERKVGETDNREKREEIGKKKNEGHFEFLI